MDTDFDIYTKLVGSNKVKENLKESLSEANYNENWTLVQDIIYFIENNINENYNQTITSIESNSFVDDFDKVEDFSEKSVWERLKYLISEQFETEEDIIQYDSVICEQIGGFFSSSSSDNKYGSDIGCKDDLGTIELIMAVEEEFDIEIPDEIAQPIRTVKDLYDVVISALETIA